MRQRRRYNSADLQKSAVRVNMIVGTAHPYGFAPFSFKAVPVKSARIVDRPRRCNSGWAFAAVVQVRHRQVMVVRPGSSPGGGFFERI